MILICRTEATSEWADGCDFAVVVVTSELLLRLSTVTEEAKKLKEKLPSLSSFAFWDYTLDYLDDIPKAWEEWVEEHLESGGWVELPYPYDPDSATDALDGLAIKLGRTECETLHATDTGVWWSAVPKHAQYLVETPTFPKLTPLEQLALTGEE